MEKIFVTQRFVCCTKEIKSQTLYDLMRWLELSYPRLIIINIFLRLFSRIFNTGTIFPNPSRILNIPSADPEQICVMQSLLFHNKPIHYFRRSTAPCDGHLATLFPLIIAQAHFI